MLLAKPLAEQKDFAPREGLSGNAFSLFFLSLFSLSERSLCLPSDKREDWKEKQKPRTAKKRLFPRKKNHFDLNKDLRYRQGTAEQTRKQWPTVGMLPKRQNSYLRTNK